MSLPYELPIVFGGEDTVNALAKVTDHVDAAVSRLIEQYRDKPLFRKLVEITGARAQILEDALWQLFTERSVETAVGEQLDMLGRVVGQPRQSFADDDYRLHIRARVKLNRSSGTVPELLEIFRLVTPGGTTLKFVPRFPAGFRLSLGVTGFTSAQILLLLNFLRAARAGGVWGTLHWITTTEAETFAFAGGTGLGFGDTSDATAGGALAGIAS
jgi:hypothetical protein